MNRLILSLMLMTSVAIATGCSGKGTAEQSIFDKLASDMVKVKTDTGSFKICEYEVTQKLWIEVMGDNPSQMQGDDLPVEQVNWDQCQEVRPITPQ